MSGWNAIQNSIAICIETLDSFYCISSIGPKHTNFLSRSLTHTHKHSPIRICSSVFLGIKQIDIRHNIVEHVTNSIKAFCAAAKPQRNASV